MSLQASLVEYNSLEAHAAELTNLLASVNSDKIKHRRAMLDEMDRLREKYPLEGHGCCEDYGHCGDDDHRGDGDNDGDDDRGERKPRPRRR